MPPRNPGLSDAAKKALVYWPQIEYAASAGLNTADLWSILRDTALEIGLSSPGVSILGVNQLRGLATQIQRNAREVAGLADSKRLLGRMISTPPWARHNTGRNVDPVFHVRYQHTFITNGEESTEWRSSRFGGKLPRTIGDLRQAIDFDAQQLATKYGVEHAGISDLQIFRV